MEEYEIGKSIGGFISSLIAFFIGYSIYKYFKNRKEK